VRGEGSRLVELRATGVWGITLERPAASSQNPLPSKGFRPENELNLGTSNREHGSCSGSTGEPLFFPANSRRARG
jgi:hypothetical protein